MSNSRRLRRAGSHARANARQVIADAVARYPDMVAEAVAAPERPATSQVVQETGVVEAPRGQRPGRMFVQLIRAGWSLNGRYYPAEVLRRDGPGAFPAGTQTFIDHPTEEENAERPAGTITRLAGVLTSAAKWDNDKQALTAEVRLFAPWRQTLTDMAEHIGMSIRAMVLGDHGEAEGQHGFVVDEITAGRSVDFVTVPAAGGAILSVIESAQPRDAREARNIGAWLESRLHFKLTQLGDEMYGDGRLTRDERIALSSAIGDALRAWVTRVEADAPQLFERDLFDEPPAPDEQQADEAPVEDTRSRLHRAVAAAHGDEDGRFAWVLDFDPEAAVVWFEADDKLWQQSYTAENRQITLAGDRVEVIRRSVYEPLAAAGEAAPAPTPTPAGPPPADTTPTAEAPAADPAVQPLPVAEVATELRRIDQLLGDRAPTDLPASAGTGQNAGGSPPTAPTTNEEAPMSGSQAGTTPDQAGTASEARNDNTTGSPAAANEAHVAVVVQERDQYRARAHSLAEALTEAQNAQRRAEAERDQAVTEMRRYRANEAGRTTVDRLLAAPESGVPDNLQGFIAPRVHAAVQDRVPLTDAGEVNQEALESLIASAIRQERVHAAQLLEAQGVGRVDGLGAEGDPTAQMTAEQFEKQVSGLFAEIGLDETTATLATKGR